MSEMIMCQSCGMPMGDTKEHFGKNADGSLSEDYCKYCYENGAFSSEETMDSMIEICVPHVVEADKTMSEDQARVMMKQFFPSLNRWQA